MLGLVLFIIFTAGIFLFSRSIAKQNNDKETISRGCDISDYQYFEQKR